MAKKPKATTNPPKVPITLNPAYAAAWRAAAAQAAKTNPAASVPGAAAPTPAAPVPPPFSLAAGNAIGSALNNYNDTIANLGTQSGEASLAYGIDPVTGQLRTDTPYGRAQLLQRSFENQTKGDTNSYAARGQLYSGALGSRQKNTTFGFLANKNQLLQQFNQVMSQIAAARQQAKDQYYQSATGAQGQAADSGYATPTVPIV